MKLNYKKKETIKKLFYIIKYFGLSKFIILSFILFSAVFLELLSIGLILPLISVLQNKDFINQYFNFFSFLSNLTHKNQIISILIFLIIISIIKFLVFIFLNSFQYKYSLNLQSEISKKLITKHIEMAYENYFNKKSSEVLRNIMLDAVSFVHGILIPIIYLSTEFLIIAGITILLIYQIGFITSVVIIFLILFGVLYVRFSKRIIKDLGNQRFILDEKIINSSNEAFSGIREIKVNKIENIFLSSFYSLFDKNALVMSKYYTLQNLPRLAIELLLVFFLSLTMLFLVQKNLEFSKIISLLSLLAIAAIRLIPSTSKIMTSQQNIRFNYNSIYSIFHELKENKFINNKNKKVINFEELMELKNINFSYYRNKNKILNKLNINIKNGDRIGIIGKTGSGKSTLVDLISGLLPCYDGKIIIDGKIFDQSKFMWGKNLGYVSQNPYLFNDTIKFNISFNNEIENYEEIYKILEIVEALQFIKKLENGINTIVGEKAVTLSGGQIQRIGIARSLFLKPQLLILDEAFSAIDNITENKIVKNIFNNFSEMTIINIAHKGKSISSCNKIYDLSKNKFIKY
jgi:ABC-type multidrug transport system fused ATPase/permease subunit